MTSLALVPWPMIFSTMLLSIIGLVGNALIVLATLISKQLQSRCNVLIACLASTDFVACIYFIELRVFMFQGWYMVSNRDCFLVSIAGLFALNVQSSIGIVLGIDRLLAVTIPIKYGRIPKMWYSPMLIVVLVYSTAITFYAYLDVSEEQTVAVCLPPTAYNTSSRIVWIMSSFVIAIIVILVYAAAHWKCHVMKAGNTNETSVLRLKRLLSSLTLVICMYSGTWFLTVISLLLTQTLPMSISTIAMINQQLGWLVLINASSNFFIYYWRAPEYRKAFLFMLTLGSTTNPNSAGQSKVTNISNAQKEHRTSSVIRI